MFNKILFISLIITISACGGRNGGGLNITAGTPNTPASTEEQTVLSINEGSSYNFGGIISGTKEHSFTVNINGGSASDVLETTLTDPFSFKGGVFPGTGGNCSSTIDTACTLVIEFNPSAVGDFSGTMTLSYVIEGKAQTVTISLTGAKQTVAVLSINGADYDFGSVGIGSAGEHTFNITKTGTASATTVSDTTLASPFRYKGGSYPGTGGTCGATIGSDCTIVVEYAPLSSGASNSTITLSYNDGAQVQTTTKNVSGTGFAPATLSISDAGYSYGSIVVGNVAEYSFTVTKGGDVNATGVGDTTLASPFRYKGGSYPGTGGTCGATIAANCSIVVEFAPSSGPANYNGTIKLDYNNGASNQSASNSISGASLAAATLSISDAGYNYGNVVIGNVAEHTFTVTKGGDVNATGVSETTLALPFRFKGGSYPGTGGNCGSPITASCTMVVEFVPTAGGAANSTITLSFNDGHQAQTATRAITGTGQTPATLTISDAGYNYGNVVIGNVAEHTFTVTKGGDVNATGVSETTLALPFRFKGGTYPGTAGTCGSPITASCTIVVEFVPTAGGAANSTITLSFNDGYQAQTATRAITGTGQTPATLTISDAGYSYGDVTINTTADHTFTVTKGGNANATGVSETTLALPFRYKGGSYPGTGGDCGATISATCYIVVQFAPTVTGSANSTITLSFNDGYQAQTATRAISGQGVDPTPAVLTLSGGATHDFGNKGYGRSADYSITVTKTGDLSATGVSGDISSPFEFKGGSFPGTGGDCTTTISANCTVVVTFKPTSTGTFSHVFKLDFTSGGTGYSSTTVTLQGYGFNPLSTGDTHSCFIIDGGSVKCWGNNWIGQLGLGDSDNRGDGINEMGANLPAVSLGTAAKGIACSENTSCALLEDNTIKCWGYNVYGELGTGDTDDYELSPTSAVSLGTGKTAKQLFSGPNSSAFCAILNDDTLKCWGLNDHGQLGYGDVTNRGKTVASMGDNLPTVNLGGKTAVQVMLISVATCALLDDGTLKCWGLNNGGQLGLGDSTERHSPPAANLDLNGTVKALATGALWSSCAIMSDDYMKCWGWNDTSQLGYGDFSGRGTNAVEMGSNLPTLSIGGTSKVSSIATGEQYNCVIRDDGTVKCWGDNTNGQLGYGDAANRYNVPSTYTTLTLGSAALSLTATNTFTCAYLSNDQVKCWGDNTNGELGQGDTTARNDSNVTAISF